MFCFSLTRPHSKSFIYTQEEIQLMVEDITIAKHINILVGGGLDFENIKKVMKNTKAPQYQFETTVIDDKLVFVGTIGKEYY
ncbi:hypothetical protein [Clostridium lacusfryxellense]|uniref:hypothetical protein n=1 Tax=Clostridium lacusfryxellense TaxID=205328 RepID=UPI001C0E528C|nr:hypothetical protein [Clostridium lacusfryxellense]MBU3114808.1 hypothetical protein [Clostridium lacusfryxellense]